MQGERLNSFKAPGRDAGPFWPRLIERREIEDWLRREIDSSVFFALVCVFGPMQPISAPPRWPGQDPREKGNEPEPG